MTTNIEIEKKKLKEEKAAIKKEMAKLKTKLENITNKEYQLTTIDSYNAQDILEIIAYLVSKIEDKNFIIKEEHISFFIKKKKFEIAPYSLVYLTEKAKAEIKQRFPYSLEQIISIYSLSDKIAPSLYTYTNDIFSIPSDNYIQLLYYNRIFGVNQLTFQNKNDTEIIRDRNAQIFDKRYLYIYDFINLLTTFRLSKKDFTITKEEMIAVANEFIKNFLENQQIEQNKGQQKTKNNQSKNS